MASESSHRLYLALLEFTHADIHVNSRGGEQYIVPTPRLFSSVCKYSRVSVDVDSPVPKALGEVFLPVDPTRAYLDVVVGLSWVTPLANMHRRCPFQGRALPAPSLGFCAKFQGQ